MTAERSADGSRSTPATISVDLFLLAGFAGAQRLLLMVEGTGDPAATLAG